MSSRASSVTPGVLDVRLLGPPRIEAAGRPVEVDTRKAVAMLAYLAITGETPRRDTLAGLLWPEYDDRRARATLRRTLSVLRAGLHGDWVDVERDTVGLERSGLQVDVEEFRHLAAGCQTHSPSPDTGCASCVGSLAAASHLWHGDFMAGFALRDSAPFDDWQFFQAEGLRREYAVVLERLVSGLLERGDLSAAIESARRWLSLDELNESAHRRLMHLYAAGGQRSAALRQYRRCVAVLEQELGVGPLEETTALYEAILTDRVPEQSAPAPSPGTVTTSGYPLVGRARERAALGAAYEAVASDGRLVVVEGEAGVGKTRLVDDFLSEISRRGAIVLSVRCYEDESQVPYGPIADSLRMAARVGGWTERVAPHRLSDVARLVPELSASVSSEMLPSDPGARRRFLDSVAAVLTEALAAPQPGVLFVDDMQWADEASIDVLAHVVRRMSGTPVLVVLAWRPEDVGPSDRLRRLASETRRTPSVTTITLTRLNRDDVASLAAHASSNLGPSDIDRLWSESEGLPLFCVEYLAAVESRGEPDWSLPEGVRDLLRSRLERASETARQVLAAAAVVGRPTDPDLLRDVGGRSMDETVTALEELSGRRLLVESPPGSGLFDFAHDKLREVVVSECGPARRRLLHARSGDALARRARGPEASALAAVVAGHYAAGGRDLDAATWFAEAGALARQVFAHAEAVSNLSSSLALGPPDPAAVHEALGDVLTLQGAYADALAHYETAAARGGEERLARIEHRIASVCERRGDLEAADRHLEIALAAADDDAARRARVLADRSLIAHRGGDTSSAADLAARSLEAAELDADARAIAQAHNVCGIVAGASGDREAARRHLELSLDHAQRLADPSMRVAALNNLALDLKAEGDIDRAIDLTTEALQACSAMGDMHRQAALHSNLADLLHATGRDEESRDHQLASVRLFAELGEREGMQPAIWKLVEW